MQSRPIQQSRSLRSLDVLHVDDDRDVRDVVEVVVGQNPLFTIRSCASGKEALITTADWSPDLILLGIDMPDMDGPTTLTRLQANPQTAGVPVIYVTAMASAQGALDVQLAASPA